MRSVIIYVSIHHLNTQKIALEMAKAIGADCFHPDEVDAQNLSAYDLIGFGSGIYFSAHHKDILAFVNQPALQLREKKVFVFSTSGFEELVFHEPLKDRLTSRGARVVGEFKCGGWHTYGPFEIGGGLQQGRPDRMDLQNAADFARELVQGIGEHRDSDRDESW